MEAAQKMMMKATSSWSMAAVAFSRELVGHLGGGTVLGEPPTTALALKELVVGLPQQPSDRHLRHRHLRL